MKTFRVITKDTTFNGTAFGLHFRNGTAEATEETLDTAAIQKLEKEGYFVEQIATIEDTAPMEMKPAEAPKTSRRTSHAKE